MTILVIAEHDNVSIKSSTLSTLAAAKAVGGEIDVLVAGMNCIAVAQSAAQCAGVRRVLVVEDAKLEHALPEHLAQAVAAAMKTSDYSHVFFTSGSVARAAMPRVAALTGVPAITEVSAVVSADTFKRYIYAGGVLATVHTDAKPVIASVRSTSFEADEAKGGSAAIESLTADLTARSFEFVSIEEARSDRPDLLTARCVCAGGRGLIDEAGFEALQTLADKIGAALGSTRAAVDMRLASNETQVSVRPL